MTIILERNNLSEEGPMVSEDTAHHGKQESRVHGRGRSGVVVSSYHDGLRKKYNIAHETRTRDRYNLQKHSPSCLLPEFLNTQILQNSTTSYKAAKM